MTRLALKDYTFSDGTTVPKGGMVSVAAGPIHTDMENYENPDVFDPWRFSNIRDEDGEGVKHQLVATALDYVPFGHGKHAWYVRNTHMIARLDWGVRMLMSGSIALADSSLRTSSRRCWHTLSSTTT